ncbi:MAG: hypothetical protein QOE77_2825 [Blastocatellia bacterium]|jgi:CHAT domain-containing protein/Tfp pilus assembly protein PilF|nr:hypothetical protein [Blastocatellia bacterium]
MKKLLLKNLEYHGSCFIFLLTLLVTPTGMAKSYGTAHSAKGARLSASPHVAQDPKAIEVRGLSMGLPVEQQLSGGEAHSYRVSLRAGQYLRVVVVQKGIDVVVSLFGPDETKLSVVDNDTTMGSESIVVIADAPGDYRVEVQSRNKGSKAGTYQITLTELRTATAKDRDHLAAEIKFEEGNRLRDERTADSRRKGIEQYEAALKLWREAGEKKGEAYTFNEIGVLYATLGEPQKALGYYDQAVTLWRQMGDRLNEGNTKNNIGSAYTRLGDMQKALEYYAQALSLKRAVADLPSAAITLQSMGATYGVLGQHQEALKYLNEALLLIRDAGDRETEIVTLNHIANTYSFLGEMQRALEFHNQALALAVSAGDRGLEARVLADVSSVYWRLGDKQKNFEYKYQALALLRIVGDKRREAFVLAGLGFAYVDSGEPQKALEHFHQARTLWQAVGDRLGEATTLTYLGNCYSKLGERQKALNYLDQALSLLRAIGNKSSEVFALTSIGATYNAFGEPQRALDYLEQALKISNAIGDRNGKANALYRIANTQRALGNLRDARTQIEDALTLIESTRAELASQDLRTSLLASRQEYYEFYVDLLMRLHQQQPAAGSDVAAFGASERARARSLLELLAEARIDVRQGIALALKQRENQLQNRISWVQTQLIQAHSRTQPDQSKIALLEEDFKKAESERAQVAIEIRQKHPRYANLQYPSPLGVKDIQQWLDEKTVLLEYSLGNEASYLFAISKHDFLTARLPAASLLRNQVIALRETVAGRPDRMGLSNYLQKARALFQDLVLPANRLLQGKQSLIIVPDGVLHYLPFEALLQSDSGRLATQLDLRQLPYLVRDFSISYAPSATVLVNLRSINPASAPRKTFLAFGDPLYGPTEPDRRAPIRTAFRSAFGEGKPWDLQPLPESRHEVERIAKLYPRERVGVFLGDRANEENVKVGDSLGQYRFVHFAVHGLLNENKPQYSGLVLSLPRAAPAAKDKDGLAVAGSFGSPAFVPATKSAAAEDGLLQVYEIFDLKLNSDLVVLSSCESGLGKETKGEGLVGLTQAFFYAGTPSLMVSLWKVQDKSTGELMVRFYRHLNNPAFGKAQALRQAQLDMIRSGDYSHPYYWAGFVLTGRP